MTKVKRLRTALTKSLPDYVTDGLVLWLDGEEPLIPDETEEDTSASIWRDRAINGQIANVGGVVKLGDAMLFDGVNSHGQIKNTEVVALSQILKGLKERTLEIVCRLDSTDSAQVVILGEGNTASPEIGAAGLWYRPDSGGFKIGTWNATPTMIAENVTERSSYSIVYGDSSLQDFDFFQNGNLCAKGDSVGNMYSSTNAIGSRLKTDGVTWQYKMCGEISCIRIYSRKLTDAERLRNLEIDKRRFGINAG